MMWGARFWMSVSSNDECQILNDEVGSSQETALSSPKEGDLGERRR